MPHERAAAVRTAKCACRGAEEERRSDLLFRAELNCCGRDVLISLLQVRARLVETLVDLWNASPPPLVNATDADALPPPPPTALPASAGAPERDANADSKAALMVLTGGLETGGGDGVAAAAAAGASLLEREPAAIAHGGDALKKHSLLKAEDALAALRHVVRPPLTAHAALLLLLGRIRRETLPAFAPPGVLRAC